MTKPKPEKTLGDKMTILLNLGQKRIFKKNYIKVNHKKGLMSGTKLIFEGVKLTLTIL